MPKKILRRPVAIDLFAGAGGLSLGFEQAGFDVAAAVEVDPVHCAVHLFNFPHCKVLPRSVTDVSGTDLLRASGRKRGEVDVMIGGPPCQGFSLMGQRVLDDPRNSLVRDFLRLIKEVRPRSFLFENVKGLTVGKHKAILAELIQAFSGLGYDVREPWRVLNAENYGVPQSRQRLFLLGVEKGEALPEYPSPVSAPSDHDTQSLFLKRTPTCSEALSDLPEAEDFEALLDDDFVRTEKWGAPSEYSAEMRCTREEHWHFGYRRGWDPQVLTSSIRTNHSEISRRRFAETPEGKVEPVSRLFKLPSEGQSNTLRAGTDSTRGAFTSPRPIHYASPRCVTVREMARLHGFPDWFRLHRTKWHGARQIGNAVPPPLARALAQEVVRSLGYKPVRPDELVELGDPSLLGLDMTAAADFWGVDVPIRKRDRKSGAKKRKQEDIEAERLRVRGQG